MFTVLLLFSFLLTVAVGSLFILLKRAEDRAEHLRRRVFELHREAERLHHHCDLYRSELETASGRFQQIRAAITRRPPRRRWLKIARLVAQLAA